MRSEKIMEEQVEKELQPDGMSGFDSRGTGEPQKVLEHSHGSGSDQ